jgi:hypothetical protein
VRPVHVRKTFNPDKERLYPRRERLYPQMREQRYLSEVLNPFRQIMAQEYGQDHRKTWDIILLGYSPTTGPDSLYEEWEWGSTQTKNERQPA